MNSARRPLVPVRAGWLAALSLLTAALACKTSAGPAAEPTTPPSDATEAPAPPPVSPVVDATRMKADLEFLSSDALRGRFTFSEDLGAAADYIAAQYEAMGIAPVGGSYRVPFQIPAGSRPGDALTMWIEDADGGSRQVAGQELVTLCNGGGKPAYAKAVALSTLAGAKASVVSRKIVVAPAPPVDRRNALVEALAEAGAEGLLLVGERPPPNGEESRKALGELSLPVAWIDRESAKEWLGIDATGKGAPKLPGAIRLSMAATRETELEDSFNVLAVLPGREHPEQIVMLGAHYDHIGTSAKGLMCREKDGDATCNGADDNASGTAMVLAIARAYAETGYQPARTVVFAHFAGEELGLHGSKGLAKAPPDAAPFAEGTIVAMVNLDMVGRLGEEGLAIGGLSSSDAWMSLLEPVEPPGLPIVYERAINARSDHASFYRKKIPVLFFFTGLHDDYHQVGDHFDRINHAGMATIGQLVADVTRALADGAEVPYAEPRSDDEGVVSRMPGSKDATVERRAGPSDAPDKASGEASLEASPDR